MTFLVRPAVTYRALELDVPGFALGLLAASYAVFPLLLAVPTGGLLVRLFIIQHDCGHGSFFKTRPANDLLGRAQLGSEELLGVGRVQPGDRRATATCSPLRTVRSAGTARAGPGAR